MANNMYQEGGAPLRRSTFYLAFCLALGVGLVTGYYYGRQASELVVVAPAEEHAANVVVNRVAGHGGRLMLYEQSVAAGQDRTEGSSWAESEPTVLYAAGPAPVDYPASLFESSTVDLDGDGVEETAELWVDALHIDGEWAFEDGQRWVLLVRDGETTYPLYDAFIPEEGARFWAFNAPERELVLEVEGSGLRLYAVTWDDVLKQYLVEQRFATRGVPASTTPVGP